MNSNPNEYHFPEAKKGIPNQLTILQTPSTDSFHLKPEYTKEKVVRKPRDSIKSTTHQNIIDAFQEEEEEEDVGSSLSESAGEIEKKIKMASSTTSIKATNGKNVRETFANSKKWAWLCAKVKKIEFFLCFSSVEENRSFHGKKLGLSPLEKSTMTSEEKTLPGSSWPIRL